MVFVTGKFVTMNITGDRSDHLCHAGCNAVNRSPPHVTVFMGIVVFCRFFRIPIAVVWRHSMGNYHSREQDVFWLTLFFTLFSGALTST